MEFINGSTFGAISATINVLFVLLIISYFFNKSIENAGTRVEGKDWILVVIGVAYTQIAVGVLDLFLPWNAAFIGLLAYSVSGFPMAYGAHQRHKEVQGRAEQALRNDT